MPEVRSRILNYRAEMLKDHPKYYEEKRNQVEYEFSNKRKFIARETYPYEEE